MSDDAKGPTIGNGLSAGDAEVLEMIAAHKRAATNGGGNPLWRAQLEAEASGLETLAVALRDPTRYGIPEMFEGRGGEAAPRDDSDMPGRLREVVQVVNGSSGMLAADAGLARLLLARDAGALDLAVEAAEDAGANTAIEKMLAHQLAVAHQLAMSLLAVAQGDVHRHRKAPHVNTGAMAEACRNTHAASRLMDAFARGAMALDRLRNGSRQVVTVIHHTEVHEGGQAIVAGTVNAKPAGK